MKEILLLIVIFFLFPLSVFAGTDINLATTTTWNIRTLGDVASLNLGYPQSGQQARAYGDFNGDGFSEIAVFNGGVFYIDFNCDGVVDKTVYFGKNGDIPIIGDWINDGKDHVGIYRPIEGRFYFDYKIH